MNKCIPDGAEYLLDEYDAERFWSRINFHGGQHYLRDRLARLDAGAGDCWIYGGDAYAAEYGRFKLHGVEQQAHRIAYRDFGNKLTDEQTIDHLCRNTLCVNPRHLEPVTQTENVRRGIAANKTHCPSGHEYTPENTKMVIRRGLQVRYCRLCLKASAHATYERNKTK